MNQQDRLAARRPSVALLEERVHRLESRVTTLADALRLLARGLEDGPMSEPGDAGDHDQRHARHIADQHRP